MSENSTSRHNDAAEHTRWNFAVITTESSAFMIGLAWVDPATVLPLFIYRLTHSTVLVGVTAVLQRLGYMLPQLPIAAIIGHRPRRAPILRWGVLLGRMPFIAFVIFLWTRGIQNATFVIWFMMGAYFFAATGNGVVAVPWQDIIAKSIPARLRGRFFAAQQLICAFAAVGVGFVVRWILGPGGPGFPRDYTILFSLLVTGFIISAIGCWMIREPIRPVWDRPQSLRKIIAGAGPMLRDHRAFRYLVLTILLGTSLNFTTPFYMVYARQELGVPESIAGVYIWAMTLSGAAFSWIWGQFNDRKGPRGVLRGACTCIALTPFTALAIPALVHAAAPLAPRLGDLLPYLFAPVFLMAGSATGGMWMGSINYLFELSSHEERPRYIALMNFLGAPGAFMPLLIGWLLTFLPFRLVFAFLALCGIGAAVAAWRLPSPSPNHRVSPPPLDTDAAGQ